MTPTARLALLALCATLSGCAALEGDRVDYRSAAKAPSLDVPPDLTQLARDTRYVAPGTPVTASTFGTAQSARPTQQVAATQMGDVRIQRDGDRRWLVVDRPADAIWAPVREFWQENGFVLTTDQPELGILETDWAENRAKIPQDLIRNTIGRLFSAVYSVPERDRFRTRLERTGNGSTEIFITHRGMVEVYTDNQQRAQTVWQPRPADPELEAEFLRRLMVRLGVTEERSRALVAASSPARPAARVATVGQVPVVQLDEGFDRAWRRVGLTLDRTGFTVEDRDRSQGVYFVRYVEPTSGPGSQPGLFSRVFGRGQASAQAPLKYRIAVRSQGDSTTVSVLDANGTPEASASAQRIVQVLADDLK
jgi:outer membrane protein assembly factor BamC